MDRAVVEPALDGRLRWRDHRTVISLLRPSDEAIDAFRARMKDAALGYPEVGATRDDAMPPGYHVDRSEEVVGEGEADFAALSKALAGFCYYDAPGGRVRIVEPRPPLEVGEVVCLLGRHVGVWTLSACRIVYTFDEPRAFGFGYGTLEHAVRGEERFELALRDDGAVVFRLLAFSVPDRWLIRLGAPVARAFQKRAGRDYADGLRGALTQ